MRAVRKLAEGFGHVSLVETEVRAPAPDEVVLDVLGTGVCGTDLHIFEGHYRVRPPVTLGHEICGRVAEVGAEVDPAWKGRRVVTEVYAATCGACDLCRSGSPNLCSQRRSIGAYADGGFAAQCVVPARNLHPVPDRLSDHAATLTEPLACVCHSLCDPPRVQPGDHVLVTGPGPVGVLAAQVARAVGASVLVIGTRRDTDRLALARQIGLETEIADGRVAVEWPRGAERGADVAVECSGNEQAVAMVWRSTRPKGHVIQMGLTGRDVSLPLDEICLRELTVTSGFASTPISWTRASDLLASGQLTLEPLVSERAPLSAWHDVFESIRRSEGMKHVLDPRLD